MKKWMDTVKWKKYLGKIWMEKYQWTEFGWKNAEGGIWNLDLEN